MNFDFQKLVYWWNHLPENISPIFITIGSIQIRYYSLMFLTAIFVSYLLVLYRIKNDRSPYSKENLDDFTTWAIIGALLGGRLGYVFFYDFLYYLKNPLEIILPFSIQNGFRFTGISGMSYHGGLIGVILATVLFCKKRNINFWHFSNFIIPAIPAGYMFGRIGNFLNGELFGRITTLPWGMYFPMDLTHKLRHPSQLYEAFFEGVVLFILLWSLRNKKSLENSLFPIYLIGYSLVRFFIEFSREPDMHLGFVFSYLSMGQVLSIFMLVAGLILFFKTKNT